MSPLTARGGRVSTLARRLAVAFVAAAGVLATAAVAWAYWSAAGSGVGVATAGDLTFPAGPSATVGGGGANVTVSWSAVESVGSSGGDGYYVQRHSGGTTTPACGSAPNTLLAATTTSCTDAGVPNGDWTYTVTAVAGSWTAQSPASTPVRVDVRVSFRVDVPSTVVAGTPADLSVTAVDGTGATLTKYTGLVAFTSSDPGAVLPGNFRFQPRDQGTVTFAAGMTLFTGPSQVVTVTDTQDSTLTGSTNVVVRAGAEARIVFSVQPGDGTSDAPWTRQPRVSVRDAYGNLVTHSSATVSLSLASGTSGGLLSCTTLSTAVVDGVADFVGCAIDKAGSYTLSATSGSMTATSASLSVAPGTASRLVLTTQPSNVVAGEVIGPAVTAEVQDPAGNVVTDSTATVSVAFGANPGGAVLGGTASVGVSGGIATFTDLTVNRSSASSYTISVSSTGLSPATSTAFTVTAGAPAQLNFTVNPGGGTGATTWSTQPKVAVQDALGNQVLNSTASVSLAIRSGAAGGTLTCAATTKAAVGGLVSFTSCKIDKAATYTLTATSSGLADGVSDSFNVTTGAATKLGYTVQPSAVVAGSIISPAVTVAVQDAGGNTVTTSSATVNLAIGTNPGGGSLSGTVATKVSNGVATFSDLSINRSSATNHTLVASATSLTSATSSGFVVSAGTPTRLAFTVEPGGGTGGTNWATQPRVAVQDELGNNVLNSPVSVALTITAGTGTPGAALTCAPRTTSSGVATFSGCRIDKAGTGYTLTASSGSLATDVSAPFAVNVGSASKLVYSTQPTAVTAGAAINPAVTVTVQDAGGNTVVTSNATVTLAIGTNPASGTLSGTLSRAVSSGVASFPDLSINRSSTTGYTLVASSTGLANLTSSTFVVSAGAASQIAFTTQPGGGSANAIWAVQPKVTVQDALGNTVPSSAAAVQLSITSGTGTAGAVLTCTTNPRSSVSGVATFAGCKIDRAGTGYTLRATSGSWTAVSSIFTIS